MILILKKSKTKSCSSYNIPNKTASSCATKSNIGILSDGDDSVELL